MAKYQIERRILEDVELEEGESMSLAEAAGLVGRSVWAIVDRLNKGSLTTVINPNSRTAFGRHRRLVLRSEIEELLRKQAAP